MKYFVVKLFFLAAQICYGENMTPVLNSPNNHCQSDGCIYYEWTFSSDESLRYIGSGYEDGIDYSLYKINSVGELELLLRVNPIVRDEHGKFWWGYPWATRDIPLTVKEGKILLYAAFNHGILRDGNISIPEWQKNLPALLLLGEHGQWNLQQDEYDFRLFTLDELVKYAKIEN